MADPFVGEIRAFGFNFAPQGWAMCNGQILSIAQNTALFSLLGTFYGGDGKSNFALPNLEGQVPIHQGQGAGLSDYVLGEQGGVDSVTLLSTEMPSHSHNALAVAAKGTSAEPTGGFWAEAAAARGSVPSYSDQTTSPVALNPAAIGTAGGSQAHENRPPLLVVNFCIALQGVYPARN
jgi:microcystin-dependent protein